MGFMFYADWMLPGHFALELRAQMGVQCRNGEFFRRLRTAMDLGDLSLSTSHIALAI